MKDRRAKFLARAMAEKKGEKRKRKIPLVRRRKCLRQIRVHLPKLGDALYTPYQLMEALLRAKEALRVERGNAIFMKRLEKAKEFSRAMLAVSAAKQELARMLRLPRYPVDSDEIPGEPSPLRGNSYRRERIRKLE
jgi:hypothetical protein